MKEMVQSRAQDVIYYPVSDKKMVRGQGIYLYDEDGREYIDCASATFNLSLGYSHPQVVQTMQEPEPTRDDVYAYTYAPSAVDAVYPGDYTGLPGGR